MKKKGYYEYDPEIYPISCAYQSVWTRKIQTNALKEQKASL